MDPISLTEHVTSRGVRLAVEPGLLRGVKILGLHSQNGHHYTAAALRTALPLYENIKVNLNHPPRGQEASPRDYRDRLGRIVNVRLAADGLYGDFHFNPRHPHAEQLLWDAEHAPENVGFSHNAEGRGRRQADGFLVEEISRVRSVDLVADPATTRGLFESQVPDTYQLPATKLTELQAENQRLCEELEQLRHRVQLADRRERAARLLREAALPPEAISEVFEQMLLEAADEATQRRLIDDRQRLWAAQASGPATPVRPVSRASSAYASSTSPLPGDPAAFAARLRS